ncbi:hypothetical protein [Pseudorhodobacter sp.]|uniref:hypothetical protein n=1 Tax=Pseudorhodobacter sp. TaxID=1934400 RepID=UPI002647CC21|nr:hypothetical protein [Pseudorhodobacter sp.]MDN5785556.1 hypothetical protein [Pseudorhodobacter sp.]
MQAKEIKDRETLEAWLKGRPQGDSVLIATRAALQVAPLWFAAMGQDWASRRDLTSLSVLRSLLISWVACKYPTDDIKSAARAAAASTRAAYADSAYADSAARAASVSAAHSADAVADSAYAAYAYAVTRVYAATRAAYSDSDYAAVWGLVRAECEWLEAGGKALDGQPLWHDGENPFQSDWTSTQALWSDPQGGPYAFWLRWYGAALQGKHLNLALEHDIALIPNEDWEKGPDHIAALIADLEKKYSDQKEPSPLDDDLAQLSAAPKTKVQAVQAAIALNHEALPPTFDAIEGYITLEINRLQTLNFETDKEAEDCRRFIRVLITLYAAIQRMRANIPQNGVVTLQQASEVEKLSRLYMRKFSELPRSKADEVVNGTWMAAKGALQVTLIGASTATLMAGIGLPGMVAAAVSTMVFSPKLVPDVIKAGIEMSKSQVKP